jgi:D-arginine dehydrogenase
MKSLMNQKADIIVIGAGIAGASVAASLADSANVILLEREHQPGYHATGRSAAYFAPSYGNATVQLLSKASRDFFYHPPANFSSSDLPITSKSPLIRPREAWFIGRKDQQDSLAELASSNPELTRQSNTSTCEQVPILNPQYLHSALIDGRGGDLDVGALLQGFLRAFQNLGGKLMTREEVLSLKFANGEWAITTTTDTYTAPIVINAAGAWADATAQLAGLKPLGIKPFRRTACLVELPKSIEAGDWPLIIDADEQFYFKPDAGLLLISPANESPSEPCDAQPEDLDVAEAIDRVSSATNLDITRIAHKWAGLRSFARDRTFVTGFDPRARGFFWLAGQGGYGVQSAPALAQLAAHLITGLTLTGEYSQLAAAIETVQPDRLIN